MKIDFDPDQIQDLEQRKFCKEAIEILANSESAIMAEARLRSTTTEGQVDYLRALMASRKADLGHFPIRHPQPSCYDTVELSDFVGIQETRLDEPAATWICKLSLRWLEQKINEMIEESIEDERKANLLISLSSTQKTLAYYYGMQALGLEPRKFETGNISDFARFLHLLTGKPFKKIADSDYYDKLKIAPNVVEDQKLVNELLAVRNAFEAVGFKAPLPAIDKEISTAQNAIAEKKQAKGKK